MDQDILTQTHRILGKNPKILTVFKEIRKVASKDLPVLISGESGTCKDLVARAIHESSPRKDKSFLHINMSSAPERLAVTEIFRCSKEHPGGPQGKKSPANGDLQGGTMFLDEISEMDSDTQDTLCSFLRGRGFRCPESGEPSSPDVRMISATSRDLKERVSNGHLRHDLCDFLSAVHIKIPPLRERRDDILHLSHMFLKEAAAKFGTGTKEFSSDARDFLMKYEWPGNMRELENTIRKAVILSNDSLVTRKELLVSDVGSCSIEEFLEEKLKRYLKEMMKLEHCNLYETVLSEVEKSLIHIILKETGGNQLRAAKTLGINRNTLRTKVKEYKIRL